jgi:hypothetical protein
MNRRGLSSSFFLPCEIPSHPSGVFFSYFARSMTPPTVSGDCNSKTFTFMELSSLLRLKTFEVPLTVASPRSTSFKSLKIWLQGFSGITTTFMVRLPTRT